MFKRLSLIGFAVASAGALVLGWAEFGQSGSQPQSEIRSRKGTPIATLIESRPGGPDDIVRIEKDQQPPHSIEPPPGMTALEWMTFRSPLVVLVKIQRLESTLTPDADWITTTVYAQVQEVLKKPADDLLAPSSEVRFLQDGGELRVNGRRVQAQLSWTGGFYLEGTYLLFAERLAETGLLQPNIGWSYQIVDARLKPLARKGSPLTEATIRLEDAKNRIRSAREGR